jgi:ABC-type Na+ efflux pump permease subunit
MLWAATATVVLGLALLGLLAGADTASGNSALMRQLNDAATVVGTAFALALLLTVVLAVVAHRRA